MALSVESGSHDQKSQRMKKWVAVSFGALDMYEWNEKASGLDVMLLPIYPVDEPIGLVGGPADLWKKLVAEPTPQDTLTDAELELVLEFEMAGIAAADPDHPNRVDKLRSPWLSSPLHELVYGLVGNIALNANLELIFIKGPVLQSQGLRTREHSGDVDVLVKPAHLQALVELIGEWGWLVQPGVWDGTKVNHSITMSPGSWGCELDLHEHFPGIGIDSESAFMKMQEMTSRFNFASTNLLVPSVEFHAVIHALHLIRPNFGRQVSTILSTCAVEALRTAGTETISVAFKVGADAILHESLQLAFPSEVLPSSGPLPANWIWRAQTNRVTGYLYALRMVPWRKRLRVICRFIWPSPEALAVSERLAGGAGGTNIRLRIRRLRRGWKSFFGG